MGIENKESPPLPAKSKLSAMHRAFLLGGIMSTGIASGLFLYGSDRYRKRADEQAQEHAEQQIKSEAGENNKVIDELRNELQKAAGKLDQAKKDIQYLYDGKFIGNLKHCKTMGKIISMELNTGPLSKFEDCAYMKDVRKRALGALESCKETIDTFNGNPGYPFKDDKGNPVTSMEKIESRYIDMTQASKVSCKKGI